MHWEPSCSMRTVMTKLTAAFHYLVNVVSHIKRKTETEKSEERDADKEDTAASTAHIIQRSWQRGVHKLRAPEFCTVASDIFSIITAVSFLTRQKKKKCIDSHVPSKKRQITVRFTGHSRILCPQYENDLSSFCNLDIWKVTTGFFKKIRVPVGRQVHDDLKPGKKRSWPNQRNTPDIYLKRIRETEVAVTKVAVPSKILTPHLPNTCHKCHRFGQFARSTFILTPMPSSYHLSSPSSHILPTRSLFLALKSRHLNTGR